MLQENKLPCETVNKGAVVRELWDIENQKGEVETVLNLLGEWVGNTVVTFVLLCREVNSLFTYSNNSNIQQLTL